MAKVKKLLTVFLYILLLAGLAGAVTFAYFTYTLTDQIPQDNLSLTSVIYFSDGSILDTRFIQENRYLITLDEMPLSLQNAVIAIEDKDFYHHFGIDLRGLARAAYVNITHGEIREGGSTITQQLAKNLFLTHERTFTRKIEEALLALRLEGRYTKEEILEKYLNTISYGHGQYGIQAASLFYFGKPAGDLQLHEAALLAGIPQSPYYLSPLVDFEASKDRQERILTVMAEQGYISEQQKTTALQQPIELKSDSAGQELGDYFVDYLLQIELRDLLEEDPQLLSRGIKIYTTLDKTMQQAAEDAVASIPVSYTDEEGIRQPQGALVAIEPSTGFVKAMVGGRDYNESQYNRATQATRSPGSSFKPFLYTAALENGYTAATMITCEEITFNLPNGESYTPTDFGGGYHWRPMTIREAVKISDNVVAVRVNAELGPEVTAEYAQKMGLETKIEPYLSLPLGSNDVTLKEMTTGYIPLANEGVSSDPIVVTRIEDAQGREIYRQNEKHQIVIDPKTAYIMTDMLKGVLEPGGTGAQAGKNLDRPAAAKTGTSQDFKDAYMMGYTPDIVVGVYVGDDNYKSLGDTGGSLAGPVWKYFIQNGLKNIPPKDFSKPEGLIEVVICPNTGLLQNPICTAEGYTELFIPGTEPREQCSPENCPDCIPNTPSPWWWELWPW